MTWQLQYTHPVSTDADHHSFFVYFLDTYLNSKTPFTVSGHPDASAFKRSVKMTYPNPYNGGSDSSVYYWVDWLSTTNPTQFRWYLDFTYNTVPGDLGTYTTYSAWNQNWTTYFNASGASNIKIWESSERSDAILVTYGKRVVWFWPGCTQLAISEPIAVDTWDGSGPISNQGWVMPFVGHHGGITILNPLQNSTVTSSNKYIAVPNWGFTSESMNAMFPDGPFVFTGAAWEIGAASYESWAYATPLMDASTTDFGWWQNTPSVNTTGDDYYYIGLPSSNSTLVNDVNTGEYWLTTNGSDVSSSGAAWNFGTSEPDFS